ncbi:hypothetical protein [Streptomyces spinosus]|uniref:hypothetical protein n=1 Tax=Streptomyces spinosus TaxID=2872623 RepID=UPI001CEC7AF1|nr:hypothetical protein [Streptomyces spinosus]
MNARKRLTLMIRRDRGSMTVWSQPEVTDALDAYRTEVLRAAADRLRAIPIQCTALTGPVWYGTGWREAITQLEEIADYQKPDDQEYPGELEMLRGLLLNLRPAVRQGDIDRVQQLIASHDARAAEEAAR